MSCGNATWPTVCGVSLASLRTRRGSALATATAAAVIAAAVWLAWGALSLNAAAEQVRTDIQAATTLPVGNTAETLEQIQRSARDLQAQTQAAQWQATRWLPPVAANIDALGALAGSLDGLAQAAGPIAEQADGDAATTDKVMAILTDQGTITSLADAAVQAQAALGTAANAKTLLQPVADAINKAREQVEALKGATVEAARAAPLLADMLGATEPRTWLVMSQNPAELRGSGGLFNAYLILTVKDGKPTIKEAGSRKQLDGEFPRAEQIPYEEALMGQPKTDWGAALGEWASFNIPADFPTVARLAAAGMAKRGTPVDGVIAIDPTVVQAILAGTGPVEHQGITIDSTNAAEFFTKGIYEDFPGFTDVEKKDALAMGLTYATIDASLKRPLDIASLTKAMIDAVGAGHLKAWSATTIEQDWLASTTVGSAFSNQPNEPIVGLVNGTGGKLDAYADITITTDAGSCANDQRVTTTVSLENKAPEDLPPYVDVVLDANGKPIADSPSGRTITYVTVYPTEGWTLDDAMLNSTSTRPWPGQEAGRDALTIPITLDRGARADITLTFKATKCPEPTSRTTNETAN